MGLDNLTVLNAMTSRMGWLEQNQKEISSNIANADTPGYVPRELKKQDFKHLLETSTSSVSLAGAGNGISDPGMNVTDRKHLTPAGQLAGSPQAKDAAQKKYYESAPSGNAVILEEQMLKMSENYADHRLMTNLYQKNIDMLKMSTKTN